jgi:hypothetical protein
MIDVPLLLILKVKIPILNLIVSVSLNNPKMKNNGTTQE